MARIADQIEAAPAAAHPCRRRRRCRV